MTNPIALGRQAVEDTLPPVVLGQLDDRSRWHWLADETDGPFRPDGPVDLVLTIVLCAVACVPFLLFWCPLAWCLRAVLKVGK